MFQERVIWVSLHWLVTMFSLNESVEMGKQVFGIREKELLTDGLKWITQKELCLALLCLCFVLFFEWVRTGGNHE